MITYRIQQIPDFSIYMNLFIPSIPGLVIYFFDITNNHLEHKGLLSVSEYKMNQEEGFPCTFSGKIDENGVVHKIAGWYHKNDVSEEPVLFFVKIPNKDQMVIDNPKISEAAFVQKVKAYFQREGIRCDENGSCKTAFPMFQNEHNCKNFYEIASVGGQKIWAATEIYNGLFPIFLTDDLNKKPDFAHYDKEGKIHVVSEEYSWLVMKEPEKIES